MTENQFLMELDRALERLPEEEREDILQDIREYFTYGRQDGKTDSDIASELGSPLSIAEELIGQADLKLLAGLVPKDSLAKSEFDNVDIQIETGSLIIGPSNDGELHVDVENKTYKQQLFVDILNRTLVVTLKDEKKWNLFNFNTKSPTITVQLPAKTYEDVKLYADNGRIAGSSMESGSFKATSDNGQIQLSHIAAQQLFITSDNGAIELQAATSTKLTAKTDNGKINFKDVTAASISLETDNGSISLLNVEGETKAKTDNGRIHLLTNNLERSIDLKTDNGAITIETMSDPVNVTIQADRDAGRVSIFNSKGSRAVFGDGRHFVYLKSDNGSLTIKRI
ncbi:DUF4097 family beta strand repeat-containing protein [Planococcus sp. YIM B11945]|uniref:DUF4097 family beta strand repeat-containing protein n=1 Tax=Planococcus sp. YIM B11945 TaxID=3435410 RepID=UPI003D7DDB61